MIRFLKVFHENAVRSPDAAAIVDQGGERTTSYRELDLLSGRIASYLLDSGIKKESVVLINCPRGMELIAVRLGVMKAGAAWVLVEELMGKERIDFVCEDSRASMVFDLSHFDKASLYQPLPCEEWADPSEHDLAFIIYTSGSTGTPKGSCQEYGIYDLILEGTKPLAEDYQPMKLANLIPETYVGGIYITVGVLQFGSELHEIPLSLVRDPEGILRYFEENKINVTFMPPTLAGALIDSGKLKLDALHVGGEIVSGIYDEGFDVKNVYGPTEFGYPSCIFKLDKAYDNTPIGRFRMGEKWMLLDEDNNTGGEEGVLCISLPWFRGYRNSGDKKNCIVKDGTEYFITSDIARSEDGLITILGRSDDMIKLNGNRVDPSEIEKAVKKAAGTDFAAVRVCVRGGVRFLCAYVPDNTDLDKEYLLRELKKYIPEYMMPACFVKLKSLPLNNNGKTDRKMLPEPDIDSVFAVYSKPLNGTQEKLCRVFEEVLESGGRKVGIDDNFFLLGGDSFHALKAVLLSDIPDLTFKMIYEEQTVRNIDSALQRIKHEKVDEVFPAGGLPLTDKQKDFLKMQLKYPEDPLYELTFIIDFRKKTDPGRLKKAVNRTIGSHPGLSVVINKNGDEWRQYMSDGIGEICGFREMSDKELNKVIKDYIKPPVFDGSPLIKADIVKTPSRLVLLLDINHLICDGSSFRNVFEDILSAYEGKEPVHDPYKEVITELLKHWDAPGQQDDTAIYDRVLGDPKHRLPVMDLPGKKSITYCFEREITSLRKGVIKASGNYGASVSTIYMTAAAMALSEYNDEEDILISWIFNGRNSVEGTRSVGMFLDYHPVLFGFNRKKTIKTVISEASEQIRDTIASGRGAASLYRETGERLVFNYQGKLMSDTDSDLITNVDDIDQGDLPAAEPFKVTIDDDGEEVVLSIDYDSGLYLSSGMERYADLYIKALKNIIKEEPAGTQDRKTRSLIPSVSRALTAEQQYFLEKKLLFPERIMYNLPVLLSFGRKTDIRRLKKAVISAFGSHPALLSVIKETSDGWRQQYCPGNNRSIPVKRITKRDLRKISSCIKPFRYDGSPLFRRQIFITPDDLILFMDVDHIICDGTSMRILIEDILSSYEGRTVLEDPYLSLLEEELSYYGSEKNRKDIEYYNETYKGEHTLLPKPDLDGTRSVECTTEEVLGFLPDEAGDAAKRFHISLSAFYMLSAMLSLAVYDHSRDVMISWNYHGRSDIKSIRSVGLLIRDYPVSLKIRKRDTIGKLCESLSLQLHKDILHGNLSPFMDREKEELLCFLYQGDLLTEPDSKILEDIDLPDVPGRVAIEPMELKINISGDDVISEITYDGGIYRKESMKRFMKIYEDICLRLIKRGSEVRSIGSILPEIWNEEN